MPISSESFQFYRMILERNPTAKAACVQVKQARGKMAISSTKERQDWLMRTIPVAPLRQAEWCQA